MSDLIDDFKINFDKQTTFTIVQMIDEFLDTFKISEISNNDIVNQAKAFINNGTPLGKPGGFGTAYINNNFPNIVVKKQNICNVIDNAGMLKMAGNSTQNDLCKLSIEGSLIFKIPHTLSNKTMIFCPNYISENLIGILLHRLLNKYTPSFPRFINFGIDIPKEALEVNNTQNKLSYETSVYTSMEKYSEIHPLIKDIKTFFYLLFQISQGLSVSQQLLKFTHNDLHNFGNVMAKQNISDFENNLTGFFSDKNWLPSDDHSYINYGPDNVIVMRIKDKTFIELIFNKPINNPVNIKFSYIYGKNTIDGTYFVPENASYFINNTKTDLINEQGDIDITLNPNDTFKFRIDMKINDPFDSDIAINIFNFKYRFLDKFNSKINIYELDNGQFFYTRADFDTIITDFGFSRIETPNHMIIPAVQITAPGRKMQDPVEYNPYYDIMSFFHYSYKTALRVPTKPPSSEYRFGQFPNFDGSKGANNTILNQLMLSIFNRLINNSDSSKTLNSILKDMEDARYNIWRFKVEKLNQSPFKISNPTEMMTKLALIAKKEFNLPDFIQNKTASNVVNYLENNNFLLLDYYVNIPNDKYNGIQTESTFFPQINSSNKQDLTFYKYKIFDDINNRPDTKIDNGIEVKYIGGFTGCNPPNLTKDCPIRIQPEGYNLTFADSMEYPVVISPSIQIKTTFVDQSITVVKINQKNIKDYKYRFDCCKIDPRNYFQNSFIKSGVLINSTFFNIFKKTDTPIGYTRSQNIIFDNPIPEPYGKYYGCVAINENGKLVILKNMSEAQGYKGNVITVGPTLVWNNNIEFDNKTVLTKDSSGKFIFLSKYPKSGFVGIFNEKNWKSIPPTYQLPAPQYLMFQNDSMIIRADPFSNTEIYLLDNIDPLIDIPLQNGSISFDVQFIPGTAYYQIIDSHIIMETEIQADPLNPRTNVKINISQGQNLRIILKNNNNNQERYIIISNWNWIYNDSPNIDFGRGKEPGDLSHAANPNPRSAIAIDNDNNVYFIKVEGRDNRTKMGKPGVGMDLVQLAQFCKNGLNAKYAINLDGGQSSQIVWKKENHDYIVLSGGMDFAYPVGSIIAFVKE